MFHALERLCFERGVPMPTSFDPMLTPFDMTQLLVLLEPSMDDRPMRILSGAVVVVWVLAAVALWVAS
jgi:hypothetical protein